MDEMINLNVDGLLLFSVYAIEDGTYLAIRDSSPMFCFTGDTVEQVVEKAKAAFVGSNNV